MEILFISIGEKIEQNITEIVSSDRQSITIDVYRILKHLHNPSTSLFSKVPLVINFSNFKLLK